MAKFNAATAVESLEYDFTHYGGKAGTIPEPSVEQVNTFLSTINSAYKRILSITPDEAAEMSEEEAEQLGSGVADALAELCSNQPSREEIEALPFRVMAAFVGWVAGEISPNQATPGTIN